ncbi:MAG: 23S rRNA (adenine(2503)-C(2))-methyltransferase RlmN [Thermomicrobium sp.]|nr:23S rRNA (adenine(2503)-C(2))-methyltransferase RlmN [Thermomicrobium sp.]
MDSATTTERPIRTRPRAVPRTLHDLTLTELESWVEERGYPRYRARQLFHWAYQQLAVEYEGMTVLPKAMRAELAATLPLTGLVEVRRRVADGGDTVKFLCRTTDDHFVETVLMFYPDRTTVCVSCQIGCAVGCSFCATGLSGLIRNLDAGEMVSQVVAAARVARERGRRLSNVVVMGMGEPFHNYDQVLRFVRIVNDRQGLGLGARHITLSTAGMVPFIDRLAEEPYQVKLAVSLHAPNDALRSQLVPLNRRWPIAELLAACRRYVVKTGRRVTFEYVLIDGVNDDEKTAAELGRLLRGLLCHVNLIPYNPTPAAPLLRRPSAERIERFRRVLEHYGIPATVRYSRGVEIAAACGQLRAQEEVRRGRQAPAVALSSLPGA